MVTPVTAPITATGKVYGYDEMGVRTGAGFTPFCSALCFYKYHAVIALYLFNISRIIALHLLKGQLKFFFQMAFLRHPSAKIFLAGMDEHQLLEKIRAAIA